MRFELVELAAVTFSGAMPAWLAGFLGGGIAGGAMLLMLMLLAPIRGFGNTSMPPRLIAATVQGVDALDGGIGSAVLGYVLGVAMAGVLGGIFGLWMLVFGILHYDVFTRAGLLLGMGMLYALIIYFLTYILTLPIVNRWMLQQIPIWDFLFAYIFWGGLIGWFILIWA